VADDNDDEDDGTRFTCDVMWQARKLGNPGQINVDNRIGDAELFDVPGV
jgi:hypothetical protein